MALASVALTSDLMVERLHYRSALEKMREVVQAMEARGIIDPRLRKEIDQMKSILTSVGVQVRDK
jgi:hypothetical protein